METDMIAGSPVKGSKGITKMVEAWFIATAWG